MDRIGAFDQDDARDERGADDGIDAPFAIGTDERRMHVRAYNYWASLLDGRAYPSIEDIDPANLDDFGPHSLLLDFTNGVENPGLAFLGRALREECGVGQDIENIQGVPRSSVLSRLTDHYLQIVANRAPIGFEAEFVSQRGNPTLYRGILMPFSSDDDTIDFIYGVINWKEIADAATTAQLNHEVETALRAPVALAPAAPVWADGPSHEAEEAVAPADFDDVTAPPPAVDEPLLLTEPLLDSDAGLADWLAAARETAAAVKSADSRSRAALYRALGQAYDFSLIAASRPDDYAELLEDAGLTVQDRAPMTPIVKLVFGADYDKTRLTEFAAALTYGHRRALAAGAMPAFLDSHQGGLKGVVQAERRERAPNPRSTRTEAAQARLRRMPARATIDGDGGTDEFVLLVARRTADGRLAVLGSVEGDAGLTDRAVRRFAR